MNPISVTHLGPYPPCFGGLQVHLRRLHLSLLAVGCRSSVVCPPGLPFLPEPGVQGARPCRYSLEWVRYPGFPLPGRIIHCHDHYMWRGAVLSRLYLQGRKLVITVHNQMDAQLWGETSLHRKIGAWFLLRAPGVRWITVNETAARQLFNRGVPPKRVQVIVPYLPPNREASAATPLPDRLAAFLRERSPVLAVYGHSYLQDQSVDLYGIDLSIQAVARLRGRFPNLGLVILVPKPEPADYHQKMLRLAAESGCPGAFLFMTEGVLDASAIWRRCDAYLRPTTTDGDSLAIREALDLGVPVVASDAAPRPAGCQVFGNRNLESYVDAITAVLARGPVADPGVAVAATREEALAPYLRIYQELDPTADHPCPGGLVKAVAP